MREENIGKKLSIYFMWALQLRLHTISSSALINQNILVLMQGIMAGQAAAALLQLSLNAKAVLSDL